MVEAGHGCGAYRAPLRITFDCVPADGKGRPICIAAAPGSRSRPLFPTGSIRSFAPAAPIRPALIGFAVKNGLLPRTSRPANFGRAWFPGSRRACPPCASNRPWPILRARSWSSAHRWVSVTGFVPDVLPHVTRPRDGAPLDIARGTQNNIRASPAMGSRLAVRSGVGRSVRVAGEHLLTAADRVRGAIARSRLARGRQRRAAGITGSDAPHCESSMRRWMD